ncbi:D-serine deaminase, pyridoxal phosphate-dependent [Rathayibacter oskolensis]|uniref:D-serine deaminase, pyridoxal phosphate-dependent n=1 Tax=Rathayibacter oskolensis TaxID=1891671 RepID=A0A1X7P3H9_9MICO|nr:alanine racemase [Rathayibacter oskolensis]SMH44773.1 D-serine deaminase, pyridoxal phosphate-dependent [Rathayibacter oskolensis]
MPDASFSARSAVLDALATPALVLDEAILDRNIARVAAWAHERGLALRPHAKTHKSVEIARRQLAAGAVGLTVATVSEAEVFAAGGVEDLFIAYPLWLDAERAGRLRRVLERARVRVGVDSAESARRLAEAIPEQERSALEVVVEIDSGHHRSGVLPGEAGAIASAATEAGLEVVGVFTFPGHSYASEQRASAARDEAEALGAAAASLAQAGVPARVVSGGSTPSAAFADAAVLTELRPGVSALGDAQQWELGTIGLDSLAVTVLATIVSRRGDHLIADAGSKVLSSDRGAASTGFGRLPEFPDARITVLSEHHATITGVDLPLGTRIRIAPNHVCVAVNLADEYRVLLGDGGGASWPVDARGRNS